MTCNKCHLCFSQASDSGNRSYLWYTLPWAFNEFVQLPIPDEEISQLELLDLHHSSTMRSSSHLVRMDLICNEISPLLTQSPIMCPENIEELHLFCCDRDINLKLPSLKHLNVINSLDALHRCCSISVNIQSIIIVIQRWNVPYATGNWPALRSLRSLPNLQSLRIVLYEMHIPAGDTGCEIIAETAMWVVDFAFSFRWEGYSRVLGSDFSFERCCSFIEQLRRKIFALSGDDRPQCFTEKDGCGLIVWREERQQSLAKVVWFGRKQSLYIFVCDIWRIVIEYFLNKNDCPWCISSQFQAKGQHSYLHSTVRGRKDCLEVTRKYLFRFLVTFASNEL